MNDPWVWIEAIMTLAILSYLYKDNPVYKLAEHLFIGVAAGYYVAIEWHNVFLPNLWRPMVGIGEGEQSFGCPASKGSAVFES